MFIRHAGLGALAASLMTRESACSSAPGSFLWNAYNCGASASAPSPAPAPTQYYAPAPSPTASAPSSGTQQPTPNIDADLNRRLQEEYDARIAAEILAAQAAAQASTDQAGAVRAALEAGQVAAESGAASYANFGPGGTTIEENSYAPAAKSNAALWALIAAGGVAAVLMKRKRR